VQEVDVDGSAGVRRRLLGVALGLLAVAAVVGALGVVALDHPLAMRRYDLDQEWSVPAAVSAVVVGAAGLVMLALWRRAAGGLAALGLGALFGFMALDEVVSLHERVGDALGVTWLLPYAPVVLAGGLGWLRLVRRWDGLGPARAALVAGGLLWGASQVLEQLGTGGVGDRSVAHYAWYLVAEEEGELLGSSAFLLAGLAALLLTAPTAGSEVREGLA
jgi:hypothetical protein